MNIQHKELSVKFYKYLCDEIGTRYVVDKRRQIFAVTDVHHDGSGDLDKLYNISSGSKAEGLDLKGSDFDLMAVDNSVKVFERYDQVKNIDNKMSLTMDTQNVKPGFTKLMVHTPIIHEFFSNCIDRRTGFPYFSSTLFRQLNCNLLSINNPGTYIHGPCSTSHEGDFDFSISLHCSYWVSQALPWIVRSKYSWASNEVLQNILSYGVLFVPIGSKNSPCTDLEWRMSFSYAEKQLIFCLNHVQFLCYALLKIMLNDIIRKIFVYLLCSYFMKTIMFWLCEETDVSFWRPDNILSCFMTCFPRLIYCVENETCLHYFIPENNLFEKRFGNQHQTLLATLHGLNDLGCTCLFQTETLQSFNSYLQPSLSFNMSRSTYLPYLLLLYTISRKYSIYTASQCAASFERCLYQSIQRRKESDIYLYFSSSMCQFCGKSDSDEDLVIRKNKVLYRYLRRRLSYLLIGLNHDAVSGWLLLASFFFKNKQYSACKRLIDHCLTKFTPERFEILYEPNHLKLQQCSETQNIIGVRSLQNYTIHMVRIVNDLSIIPEDLQPFVDNGSQKYIPSLVYAHFLNFLFYHTIGDEREKRNAYRNLVLTGKHDFISTRLGAHRTNICLHIAKDLMQ